MKDIETLNDHIEAIRGTLKIAVADTKAQGLTRTWAQEALPHLEALAAHLSTSNGMTEEEIDRVARELAKESTAPDAETPNWMIASSNVPVVTVDAIMEVHRKWLDDVDCYDDWNVDAFSDLRSRLTTLFPASPPLKED